MSSIEAAVPTMPGQEVFGTIQEIVKILEADPTTDWSKVNIAALREHLIDMDEVTMRAAASERALDNGVEIAVTVKAAPSMRSSAWCRPTRMSSWRSAGRRTEDLPNGVKLIVTTADPRQVVKAQGAGIHGHHGPGRHHQAHHLMMAKGEFAH